MTSNVRAEYDTVLQTLVDYVSAAPDFSKKAYDIARYCLMDALGCAMLALNFPECGKLLGPLVPGMSCHGGSRVPGTAHVLDPVQAAFNIGTLIRWLDFNDTWLAQEWGHPSDNLGAILAVADYVAQQRQHDGLAPLRMKDILTAMIQAYEIQGIMALENSFNRVGLDHVILVKLASTLLSVSLWGGDRDTLLRAGSQVFVDGQSLRTYRHAPNTGSRKSWAAGDACARAVRLALISLTGEMGYPSALTAPVWGFYAVSFKEKPFVLNRPLHNYVMENILLKIAYPAEFHAQTAVEAAITLHQSYAERIEEISSIDILTHESALRIICKEGPLHNPADRDHCLQYMVAIALLYGDLQAHHYEEETAQDPRISSLREKMKVQESADFSKDYLDPDKRAIANSLRLHFTDGTSSDWVTVAYPIGHERRRAEGIPILMEKCHKNIRTRYPEGQSQKIMTAFWSLDHFMDMNFLDFMQLWECEA